MKKIGIIGGMSCESSREYYCYANRLVRNKLGGLHSARIVMTSVDFAEIQHLQKTDQWDKAAETLGREAQGLEAAGADFFLIATNTMHKIADQVQAMVKIPLLHIADATGERIRAHGFSKVALLGTRYTMEGDFYGGRLREKFGFDVLTPPEEARKEICRIIFDELCQGKTEAEAKKFYLDTIRALADRGAECVILGCTEIGLLVTEAECPLPMFDTAKIHVECAVDLALADSALKISA